MPDEPTATPNTVLAHDLRRIREARGLSLDALHEETKIPRSLLRQFEETGLADHPMFNRVYLRSLIRAYADLIGISTEEALAALDDALDGKYQGGLAAAYLDQPREGRPEAALEEDAAGGEDRDAKHPSDTVEEEVLESPSPPTTSTEAPSGLRAVPLPDEEAESQGSWDAVSPAPSARRREPVDLQQRRTYAQWGVIAVAVLVLAGVIWGVLFWITSPTGERDPDRGVVAMDTMEADAASAPPEEPPQPTVTLGDTMNVVIVAANGPVQGIRITRDDDLRRPYWIEDGQAKAFPTRQRVVIEEGLVVEEGLEPIRLLLEGYEYPTTRRDDQGRIVITRDTAQAFLDSVSTAPVDLSIDPERVPLGRIRTQ